MRKFYALALCAGVASVLAVVYTLLHLDWGVPAPDGKPAAAAAGEPGGGASGPVGDRLRS